MSLANVRLARDQAPRSTDAMHRPFEAPVGGDLVHARRPTSGGLRRAASLPAADLRGDLVGLWKFEAESGEYAQW